ncbi:MAG: DEAD/DEAH box helicase [Candidatus Nanopelagicaceae bacterium]|jgi:ATP-dependent RNA helicase HelY
MSLSPAERFQQSARSRNHPLTTEFQSRYAFDFDEFQKEGCHALERGSSVLIAAPTGSGKTIVGEFAIFKAISEGRKCFYTTPIKALSNQKFNDLVDSYGPEMVGLLTGDTNVNPDAQIVVMTTEVLRNMIYARSDSLATVSYVVMDEVHYLADKFRGAVWEEILIHLDPEVTVISLSATVSNVEEFGEWLEIVRGRTQVIVSEMRPVPLYQHVLVGHRLLDLFQEGGRINQELLRAERRQLSRSRISRERDSSIVMDKSELIRKLYREGYLPAIFFIFSRAGCDASASRLVRDGVDLTSQTEKEEIRRIVSIRTDHLPTEDLNALNFQQWLIGLERGVASHHAGMLPLFKEITEYLFQEGLLRVVFATETLALGINMPARTVVLEKLIKWNGESHVMITPGEYTQLTGRAGRRGIDVEGNSVIMWTPSLDATVAASLAGNRTYPLRSSFIPTYNMSANLLDRMSTERAMESLGLSFAQFQADKSLVGIQEQIRRNKAALAHEPEGCHMGDFGSYFELRRGIRRAEREEVKERGQRRHKALEERAERIRELRVEMRRHPCHGCAERESHARLWEKFDRLLSETESLERKVELKRSVIPRTFQRVVDVLRELNYVHGERLTESGSRLKRIFAERDLLVSEVIKNGLVSNLTAMEIPGLLSGLLYESRSEDRQLPRIPKSISESVREIAAIWGQISSLEATFGLETQSEPDYSMAWSISRWASGSSISHVLRESDVTAGDFVRHVKQIIDLLGQLMEADPSHAQKYRVALESIDRGLIRLAAVA